jgi:aspartate aminotransferase
MFETLSMAPADPILGLTEAFRNETNPHKVNLGVGVFKDAHGKTPTLSSVKKAEARILEASAAKTYLPIEGDPSYGAHVQALLFGTSSRVLADKRARTAHTPGGTGGLRVAADYARSMLGLKTIHISDPSWANHKKIFESAGLEVKSYRYYDPETRGLDFAGMREALAGFGPSDLVLLHGCCHNPTGIDPTPAQWDELASVWVERGFLPLFDLAYQGFGNGLDADAHAIRTFAERGAELLVASSYSKNFGLYNERVGALTLVASDEGVADRAFSHVKGTIRANYSNPPSHGAAIVATILGDAGLRAEWESELAAMRKRIRTMREALVQGLRSQGAKQDFTSLEKQNGMFSYTGLTPAQVDTLREQHAIYMVRSGRINVAGITETNLPYVCEAIAGVLE